MTASSDAGPLAAARRWMMHSSTGTETQIRQEKTAAAHSAPNKVPPSKPQNSQHSIPKPYVIHPEPLHNLGQSWAELPPAAQRLSTAQVSRRRPRRPAVPQKYISISPKQITLTITIVIIACFPVLKDKVRLATFLFFPRVHGFHQNK